MFDSLFLTFTGFWYIAELEREVYQAKTSLRHSTESSKRVVGQGEFLRGRGDGWRHTINMYEIQHIQRTRSRRRRSWEWEGKTQNHDEDLFSPFSSIDAGAMFESELLFDTMAERENREKLVRSSHIDFSKFTNLIKKILFLSRVESSYVALIYSLLYSSMLSAEKKKKKLLKSLAWRMRDWENWRGKKVGCLTLSREREKWRWKSGKLTHWLVNIYHPR